MHSDRLQETALGYFLEVVRSDSLSEAALGLNVSLSAVSQQFGAMEAWLDTPLFERQACRMAMESSHVLAAIQAQHMLAATTPCASCLTLAAASAPPGF